MDDTPMTVEIVDLLVARYKSRNPTGRIGDEHCKRRSNGASKRKATDEAYKSELRRGCRWWSNDITMLNTRTAYNAVITKLQGAWVRENIVSFIENDSER